MSCITKQQGDAVGRVAFPRDLEGSLDAVDGFESILVRDLVAKGALEVAF